VCVCIHNNAGPTKMVAADKGETALCTEKPPPPRQTQKNRRCTCNVTLWRVHVITVAVEKRH
jgi:hypothetical protein